MGLTDKQQAWLMFFAILLATWTTIFDVWVNNGAQTSSLALSTLLVALVGGLGASIAAWLKEYLGKGLTDTQQAWLMFTAILLGTWTPIFDIWINNGMQTTSLALGTLFVALLGGLGAAVTAWMKDYLGVAVPAA